MSDDAVSASDALMKRLRERYERDRTAQLNTQKIILGAQIQEKCDAEKDAQKNAPLEFISDETALLFNLLEAKCDNHSSSRELFALVKNIRFSVNTELRQAMSFAEEGYTSAFKELLHETERLKAKQEALAAASTSSTGAAASVGGPRDEGETAGAQAASEEKPSGNSKPKAVDRSFSLKQTFSETTSLFAEALATLLKCEAVRVYLYDENQSLHCCASYPFHALHGDPTRATYTELMLVKELHHEVCASSIAINGTAPQYTAFSAKEREVVMEELTASGLQSMHSCLVFPILPGAPDATQRPLGLLHAVNKVGIIDTQSGTFTEHDETVLSMGSRILGTILSRYPAQYFTLRVGEMFRKAVYPQYDPTVLDDHLPLHISDNVEEAAEAGNRALAAPGRIFIYRAPVNTIYQTKSQRARVKKLGRQMTEADTNLSSVEFNLKSISHLWEKGMEENVEMHKQYRSLKERQSETKLLLNNILDGLAATRSMRDAKQMARYLQKLELFGRSESTKRINDLVTEALIQRSAEAAAAGGSAAEKKNDQQTEKESESVGGGTEKVSSDTLNLSSRATSVREGLEALPPVDKPLPRTPCDDPFLSPEKQEELARQHMLRNTKIASALHHDGPEYVTSYSCDPKTKREQVRFIEEIARQGQTRPADNAATDKRLAFSASLPPTKKETTTKAPSTSSKLAQTDYARKRPFQI